MAWFLCRVGKVRKLTWPGCGSAAMQGWLGSKCLPSLVVAQEPCGVGGTQGTHKCLLRLSCCEARVGLRGLTLLSSVWRAQGSGHLPSPAVVQFLHKVGGACGAHPARCGTNAVWGGWDARCSPSPLMAQGGQSMPFGARRLGAGAPKMVPISAITSKLG